MEPKVRIYEDNDKFWDILWEKIDRAKHYALLSTYDMDHRMIAGITLQKLTNAAKRGVAVYLIVDDLNYFADEQAVAQLERAGGVTTCTTCASASFSTAITRKSN
jgi:phosphatidylserine/phosphatidylglycerophosphate/cardiolipin synthase-like enzyme